MEPSEKFRSIKSFKRLEKKVGEEVSPLKVVSLLKEEGSMRKSAIEHELDVGRNALEQALGKLEEENLVRIVPSEDEGDELVESS